MALRPEVGSIKHTHTHTHTTSKHKEPKGRAEDDLFPPASVIWAVCGRVRLAAGVLLGARSQSACGACLSLMKLCIKAIHARISAT